MRRTSSEIDPWEIVCNTCDALAADFVVTNSGFDPLQVTECGSCGSIIDIGGHKW